MSHLAHRKSAVIVLLGFLTGVVIVASGDLHHAQGQPKPPEVKPAPQAPVLATPAHLGGKIGTTLETVLTGNNLNEPTTVWFSVPGLKASIPGDNKNGTNPAQLQIQVHIPSDAPIGAWGLRLATRHGVSNVRPFVIDELPLVLEADNNRSKDTPQAVSPPVVVAGRIDAESADYYKIAVSANQTLTIEVLARRIGSPLDPMIVLHDAKTRRELVHLYADDTPGLQGDCRLIHTFAQAGEYLIEVRDSTWRGGGDYFYRLRIGDFPGATTAYPLAVQRGTSATVGFSGPGVQGVPPLTVAAPIDPNVTTLWVSPQRPGGLRGWPVPVRIHDWPEAVEKEPNDSAAQAMPLPLPGGVSAMFDKAGDRDHFRITVKKGQKVAAVARAFEFNSPCEIFIRVLDAKGKELARSNPANLPARAEFTAPEDGDYLIVCEHLNYRYGPNEVYHLSVTPVIGDFAVTPALDRVEVRSGGVTALLVNIARLDGYTGPVELSVTGHPALSGNVTVAAGQNFAFLPVQAAPQTPPGAYPFRVRGRAVIAGQEVVRDGVLVDAIKAAWGNMPNPPVDLTRWCVAAVVDPPLLAGVQLEPPLLRAGQKGRAVYSVQRTPAVDGDVAVAVLAAPPNVAVTSAPIPKGKTLSEGEVKVDAKAATGRYPVVVRFNSKIGGKDYGLVHAAWLEVAETKADPSKKDGAKESKK